MSGLVTCLLAATNPRQKQLKVGGACLGAVPGDTGSYGPGRYGCWNLASHMASPVIECWHSVHFFLFLQCEPPDHGTVLPSFRAGHPTSKLVPCV